MCLAQGHKLVGTTKFCFVLLKSARQLSYNWKKEFRREYYVTCIMVRGGIAECKLSSPPLHLRFLRVVDKNVRSHLE